MKKNKIHAVVEVLSMYFFLELIAFLFSLTSIAQIQRDVLYWNYFLTTISAAVPMLVLLRFRRDLRSYGFQCKNAKKGITWALIFVFLIILPSTLTFMFGLSTFDVTRPQPQYLVSTIIFQLVFTGTCEEVYFRGYMQSRLNEGFGRPYIAKDLQFGPGVTIASLFFGLCHVFNPFHLIIGHVGYDILGGLFAAQFGMLVGLIREKTGSIFIPILVHGLYNGFVSFFSGLTDPIQTLVIGLGCVIAWIFFFAVFIKKYKNIIKDSNFDASFEVKESI